MANEQMTLTESDDLKFSHTGKELAAHYKKKLFKMGPVIAFERDAFLDQHVADSFNKLYLEFYTKINNLPLHGATNLALVNNKIMENNYDPFYKYVPENILNNYIKKGQWQLGNIYQYRNIENKAQRDEFEGYSCLSMNINGNKVFQIVNTGFNYLIFCGTRTKNSNIHANKFGQKQLYFPNVRSFADRIAKTINAKRYIVQDVEYNTLKIFSHEEEITSNLIDVQNPLSPAYFELLKKLTPYPSLFVKPEPFAEEQEVRIVFEMPKDYFKPVKFQSKELLSYIKF